VVDYWLRQMSWQEYQNWVYDSDGVLLLQDEEAMWLMRLWQCDEEYDY